MPLVDPALEWIKAQIHPDGLPPPSKPTTDYLRAGGENPRLTAYITASLLALDLAATAPQPATPDVPGTDDEPAVVLSTYEIEAWAELGDALRAGCLRGNKASIDQWVELTVALEAEAAEQG